MKHLNEMENNLQKKLAGMDEKVAGDSRLMQMYRTDPDAFIEALDLLPEEKALFKVSFDEQPTRNCECCAVFFGSCGVGCGTYGGTAVG